MLLESKFLNIDCFYCLFLEIYKETKILFKYPGIVFHWGLFPYVLIDFLPHKSTIWFSFYVHQPSGIMGKPEEKNSMQITSDSIAIETSREKP